MKTLNVKYVRETKTGSFEYRRQVSASLRERVGLHEFKKVLGFTPAAAIKAWPAFHEQVERQLAAARQPTPLQATPGTIRTAMDSHREAVSRLKALGIDPTEPLYSDPGEFTEADALAEVFEVHDEVDSRAYGMLSGSGDVKPPAATFADAAKLYVQTKIDGSHDDHRKRLRVSRVTTFVTKALGKDPKLSDLTRSHAREVVSEMLSTDASPSTVDRYCNDIRSIIGFGIREFQLERLAINPFVKIDIKGLKAVGKVDRDERHPFSPKQLKDTRAYILQHAGSELRHIWRLLEGSGLRMSEASGLEVQDVVTAGETPHLDVRFNGNRRLKNTASIRKVPLVGDALVAATEALALVVPTHQGNSPLFAKYGRKGGGTVASAALMKNLRKVVSDPKVTVHSLRHNMQDRMITAGVGEHERHLILGHAVTGEANRYGSDQARLVATTRALTLLLPAAGTKGTPATNDTTETEVA